MARQASEKEKSKEVPMYKDNDFVSEGIKIHIGAAAKQRLMNTLKSDTDVSLVMQCWIQNTQNPSCFLTHS